MFLLGLLGERGNKDLVVRFTVLIRPTLEDGLLIWAAMVCSFLTHKMWAGAPHERLDQILSSGKWIALQGQLSNLYRDALTQLFQDDTE